MKKQTILNNSEETVVDNFSGPIQMDNTKIISLEDLKNSIIKFNVDSKPKMIAIDGPSGSGKSYFANQLSQILKGSHIVPMDDFISWNSLDVGLSRAKTQLFEPLSKGDAARYQARDWVGDIFGESLGEWKDVPACNFVIFEGIGSSRIELSSYYCVSIWVEAQKELCIQRGLKRDGAFMLEHWESSKIMEKEFFSKDQSKSRANYYIDGVSGKIFKI